MDVQISLECTQDKLVDAQNDDLRFQVVKLSSVVWLYSYLNYRVGDLKSMTVFHFLKYVTVSYLLMHVFFVISLSIAHRAHQSLYPLKNHCYINTLSNFDMKDAQDVLQGVVRDI